MYNNLFSRSFSLYRSLSLHLSLSLSSLSCLPPPSLSPSSLSPLYSMLLPPPLLQRPSTSFFIVLFCSVVVLNDSHRTARSHQGLHPSLHTHTKPFSVTHTPPHTHTHTTPHTHTHFLSGGWRKASAEILSCSTEPVTCC